MDNFQIAIEVGLSVLLLVTIFYSLHLGRALNVLRRDRAELDALLKTLQSSTTEAQSGIETLRLVADRTARALDRSVEAGRVLKGELSGLCARAEKFSGRLEGGSGVERDPASSSVDAGRKFGQDIRRLGPSVGKSAAERELLQALRLKQG